MVLQQQRPDFLKGISLGRINHVVQLAISQRKVLGYIEGGITPYSISDSRRKDIAASQQSYVGASEAAVATWTSAPGQLREVLCDAMASGLGHVPLSNIKHVFRNRFDVELSETALGHSKLSELLSDRRFANICEVRLLESGYFVVPIDVDEASNISSSPREDCLCKRPRLVSTSDESTNADSASSLGSDESESEALDSPTQWFTNPKVVVEVRNTFIQVGFASDLRNIHRSQSVPRETEMQRVASKDSYVHLRRRRFGSS